MLEVYLARPDLDHGWEEIQEGVKKIGGELSVLTKGISCKLLQSENNNIDVKPYCN